MHFTKVMFGIGFCPGSYNTVILLNIPAQELSLQTYSKPKRVPAPTVSNSKTNFTPVLLPCFDSLETQVDYSFGWHLQAKEMNSILPLCIVEDFEPYRDREMSIGDPGVIGYRDGISLYFSSIRYSPLTLI
ncbi:MAG: hypothetical protein Q4C54_07625 [Clostridia bacterium]|nr:hypothetical protein [Clostridia bacterium]